MPQRWAAWTDASVWLSGSSHTHTHTHKMCINFMDKNSKLHRKLSKERQREWERKRENDAAAAEKTKIIQKLKLEELKWGVVCCAVVVAVLAS